MSINRVVISGNLTHDAELRATASGMSVLSFGVAVNDRYFNKQTNQWEDRPNFVDCTLFGNRAQSLAQWLVKGTKVAIEGKLRFSQWQNDQGNKRSKLEVLVDEVEFLSAQRTQALQQAPQAYQPAQAAPMQQRPAQVPQQAPQMQPVQQQPAQGVMQPQQMPVQQQMAGMPQPQQVDYSIYDQDIPF